jgi:hypothetical protein
MSFGRTMLSAIAAVFVVVSLSAAPARAEVIYLPGSLNFISNDQSMWGSDTAFVKSDTIFEGTEWNDAGFKLGGITGCSDCGLFGSDDRFGAQVSVNSSGKLGLDFGYSINSGSVDTTADFGAKAILPDTVSANTFFNIATQSNLDRGTISTQSPEISASMSAVMQLSGSITGEGCFPLAGCASSTSFLPTIDVNQSILSIDPNGVDLLKGILPGGNPLLRLSLADQGVSFSTGLGVPGFKVTNSYGKPIYTTLPPGVPTTSLGSLGFNVPDVSTSNSGPGPTINSFGKDKVFNVKLDLDGLLSEAIYAATDVPVAFGTDIPLGDLGNIHIDLIDIDVGPYLALSQGFEFDPKLWVDLAFSNPVNVEGLGWQMGWEGPWNDLPAFAISQTTTFTPTFFLNAMLTNDTGLVLGLDGTWELLKVSGKLGILQIPGTSLNQALGWGDKMFDVSTQPMSIYNNTFKLDGFNSILANPFTLTLGDVQEPGGGPLGVPEPDNLLLLLFGVCALAVYRRLDLRAAKRDRATNRA